MSISGTIILCDHAYRTQEGKWVIAGTYRWWRTNGRTFDFTQHPVHLYMRLVVQEARPLALEIRMVDKTSDPRAEAVVFSHASTVIVTPGEVPVWEGCLAIAGWRMDLPPGVQPTTERPLCCPLQLELWVDKERVSWLPLEFHFLAPILPPQGGDDATPGNREGVDGDGPR